MKSLKVILVPAPDPEVSGLVHTAYTVHSEKEGALRSSPGWTLRDAIEFYARENGMADGRYRLIRPFERQEDYLRRQGIVAPFDQGRKTRDCYKDKKQTENQKELSFVPSSSALQTVTISSMISMHFLWGMRMPVPAATISSREGLPTYLTDVACSPRVPAGE